MINLVSISEAQRLLNISRATVNRLLDRGEFRRVHIGRMVRIPSEDIEAFVQRVQSTSTDD
jgi:excisionase family DNA binding protein